MLVLFGLVVVMVRAVSRGRKVVEIRTAPTGEAAPLGPPPTTNLHRKAPASDEQAP